MEIGSEEKEPFIEPLRHNYSEEIFNARKQRKTVTEAVVENFLQMIGYGNYNLKEIERNIVLSYSCVCKMYKRYLAGEFLNLCTFMSAIEKKKRVKKTILMKKTL
ncbi:hypothetical protein DMUE_2070 [Dictyocoela muelleri]|nr:hypothetical protein DMUE_2070 [Dictyocoela muelleri]